MNIPENLLHKVRALLAKAEGAATDEERAAYNAKATKLMARHSIDQAMIDHKQGTTPEPTMQRFVIANPRALAKAELLMEIADASRCKGLRGRRRASEVTVTVYGFPADIERVEILFTSLLLQMANGLEQTEVPPGVDTRAFKRAWLMGFAVEVGERLRVSQKTAEDETAPTGGKSTEIVLRDRKQAVHDLVNTHVKKIQKPKIVHVDPSGFDAGQEAGRRADLGNTRIAPNRGKLTR